MRFIPSTWLHRRQENRLPGTLCDEAPMVADGPLEPTVAAKWQPRVGGDVLELRVPSETIRAVRQHLAAAPAAPDTEDDTPPMVLLARMRQRLDFVRQSLREVTADRDRLEQVCDQRAQRIRGLEDTIRALSGHGAPMAMHATDDDLLIQPLPAPGGGVS